MKILYATDGMSPALEAGSLIERFVRREQAEVTAFSVAYSGVPALEHAVFQLDPLPSRRADAVRIVDAAAEKLRDAGFSVHGRVSEGHPAQEILRLIEDEWYDLTVVGGSARSWLGRHLLGSVSTHVLHSSPSSVLVVHELVPDKEAIDVLLVTDGSRGSDKAVQWLTRLADPGRCRITTLSVVQRPEVFLGGLPVVVPGEMVTASAELVEKARFAAEDVAARAADRLSESGFAATAHAAIGDPVEEILTQAEAGNFDVVAMGARGLGAMPRALLGSVSDQLARHVRAAFVARRFVH